MKKDILIISADFYPYPNNNTICFTPFIKKISNYYNVNIVTSYLDSDESIFKDDKNINVYRINNAYANNSTKWANRISKESNKIKKLSLYLISYITKFYVYFLNYQPHILERGYIGWSIKEVKQKCISLIEEKEIKKIISISFPYVTCDIAESLKDYYKNNIEWSIVAFDAFSINTFAYNEKTSLKRRNLEKDYFKKANKIFITPQLYRKYSKIYNNTIRKKLISLEYANLINYYDLYNDTLSFVELNENTFFYAGNLDKNVRPIDEILKFFSYLDDSFKLHIVPKYPLNYCDDLINLLGSKIQVHPRMTFDQVYTNELDSKFLISIGNVIDYQVPGKTFELMSTGKPIIHFSYIPNDPVVDYLKKYGDFFHIKLYEDTKKQVELLKLYINTEHKNLSFDDVLHQCPYYDPEKITDYFIERFNENSV